MASADFRSRCTRSSGSSCSTWRMRYAASSRHIKPSSRPRDSQRAIESVSAMDQPPRQLLNAADVRVLGSLVEKEVTTPDYYPLSLNALTNACNQSSNRHPVVHFDEESVLQATDTLRQRNLLHVVDKADSRVTKYRHVMGETMALDNRQI